jgi:small GTP-binding protein
MWDVGGQEKIRRLWRHYYRGSHALIFVVDSSDRERVSEARDELAAIMDAEEMSGAHVLVFANKQDLPGALSPSDIAEALKLRDMLPVGGRRKWWVQACCATTGDGLVDGMEWLSEAVSAAHP